MKSFILTWKIATFSEVRALAHILASSEKNCSMDGNVHELFRLQPI